MAEVASMPANRVTTSQFVTISVQAVAFVSDRSVTSGKVMAAVLKRFADRYDGDPQALPLPPEAPAEIPRVILQSAEPQFRFEASPDRLTSRWVCPDGCDVSVTDVVGLCSQVILHCLDELHPQVGRLALVVTRAAPVDDPAQTLIQSFCSQDAQLEPLNRSATFEIHNHKRYTPPGLTYMVNSWVRCRTGMIGDDKSPAIVVEQDINTLAEESSTHQFDSIGSNSFYDAIANEADGILMKYFPE